MPVLGTPLAHVTERGLYQAEKRPGVFYWRYRFMYAGRRVYGGWYKLRERAKAAMKRRRHAIAQADRVTSHSPRIAAYAA